MTELPDIAGLVAVAPADWLSLRHRLAAIGVDAAAVAPMLALGARYAEDDRDPIRLWRLRRRDDAAARAMRLLMFGDALPVAEAAATLGEKLFALVSSAGLLPVDGGQVRCTLRLAMAGDDYVFGDDLRPGGDVVMGLRDTTLPLWRAAVPNGTVPRALDLGCGAGAIALLLSHHATQVVATDINPRAVALARINVALNGVANIDVREGDLFAPVSGEAFDLIATHPPYVALPDGMAGSSHMHGGARGDELACRLLAGLAPHLAPGGRAVVQAHWPLRDGETQTARIREAAGPELDLLVLGLGATDADDLATFWGQVQQHDAASVARIRDHYAALGLARTEASLSVLRRGGTSPAWTLTLEVPPEGIASITADRIDILMAAQDLLHGENAALQAARLRVPDGASLATVQSPAGTRTILLLPPTALRPAVDVTRVVQQVIGAVHRSATVGDSAQELATVRDALAAGMLEPVAAG